MEGRPIPSRRRGRPRSMKHSKNFSSVAQLIIELLLKGVKLPISACPNRAGLGDCRRVQNQERFP
jgi:hypothetical protein